MKEAEDINISGNFVIYSSLHAYLVSHRLIISQPDCFTDLLTFLLFHCTLFLDNAFCAGIFIELISWLCGYCNNFQYASVTD